MSWIIQSGFNGDDMPGAENLGCFADARGFVNFKANAVTGAVKITLHSPVERSGFVVVAVKQIDNGSVNILAIGLSPNAFKREGLAFENGVVDVLKFDRRIAFCKKVLFGRDNIYSGIRTGMNRGTPFRFIEKAAYCPF